MKVRFQLCSPPWFRLLTIGAVVSVTGCGVFHLRLTKRALKLIVASGTLIKLDSVLRMLIRAIVSTYVDTRYRSEQPRAPPKIGTAVRNCAWRQPGATKCLRMRCRLVLNPPPTPFQVGTDIYLAHGHHHSLRPAAARGAEIAAAAIAAAIAGIAGIAAAVATAAETRTGCLRPARSDRP